MPSFQPYDQPISLWQLKRAWPSRFDKNAISLPVTLKPSTVYPAGSLIGQVTATPGLFGAYSAGTVTGTRDLVGGSGWVSNPTVTLSAPLLANTQAATGQAILDGGVLGAIQVINPGQGYSSAPTISFSGGGGGSGAAATATVAFGVVTGITITNAGSGYVTPPTVTFSAPAGTTATATGTQSAGAVNAVTIATPGSGYTIAPTITFSGGGGGTGASANATISAGASDGTQIPLAVLMYDVTTDASGNMYYGLQVPGSNSQIQTEVPAWFSGVFRVSDLVGIDAQALSVTGGKFLYGSLATPTAAEVRLFGS